MQVFRKFQFPNSHIRKFNFVANSFVQPLLRQAERALLRQAVRQAEQALQRQADQPPPQFTTLNINPTFLKKIHHDEKLNTEADGFYNYIPLWNR